MLKKYIKNCDICQRAKLSKYLPYGKINIQNISEKPWTHIFMDFIRKLPESIDLVIKIFYQRILVVIDKFTKIAYLILITIGLTAEQLAYLLIQFIFSQHGVLKKITICYITNINEGKYIVKRMGFSYRIYREWVYINHGRYTRL